MLAKGETESHRYYRWEFKIVQLLLGAIWQSIKMTTTSQTEKE